MNEDDITMLKDLAIHGTGYCFAWVIVKCRRWRTERFKSLQMEFFTLADLSFQPSAC
jgi:hypothetical protein